MLDHTVRIAACRGRSVLSTMAGALVALCVATTTWALPGSVEVTVKPSPTSPSTIPVGFRWVLEEDVTYAVTPGVPDPGSLSVNMHKSYMPVAGSGHSAAGTATIPIPDTARRYYLSVLPDQPAGVDCQIPGNCFTQSGKQVAPGATSITVITPSQPVPTAQIFIQAFEDSAPINGAWDIGEAPAEGFVVFIYDMGGQLNADTFGNPLGTVYDGLNADGTPHVRRLGDGSIHTMTQAEVNDPAKNPYGLAVGEVLIKNIAPGKYGVQVVPPFGQGWQQTTTIEGTRGIDVWVKANEPRYFAEFGPGAHHASFGYVRTANFPALATLPAPNGRGTISGRVVNEHMSRPPNYTSSAGHPLPGCWVGLNDALGSQGLYAARCNDDSTFSIPDVPSGTYQLVFFDDYLDNIITTIAVTVPPTGGLALGDVPVLRWFGSQEHWVFNDLNGDGKRDLNEVGIPDQVVNLRFRDGSIYQSSTTDTAGYLPFDEVFPFFSWLVAEVDFARFKATGVTLAVDAGGPLGSPEENGSVFPRATVGHGHLTPQIQTYDGGGETRTELGPVLLEGFNTFLGTTNLFEWGKQAYGPNENGGISGVIQYATTRAENDPRYAAAETWEPGIPRVQVNLYRSDATGAIADTNGSGVVELADVDNYPFCWTDAVADPVNCPGGFARKGTEDVNRTGPLDAGDETLTEFDQGDAIEVTHTDSWDDNVPTNCPGQNSTVTNPNPTNDPFFADGKCYDGLRNYVQVRPAVFDGGYAFGQPFTDLYLAPGHYVVEANAPPGYTHQREQDKNVDFGDTMTISPMALPPVCVGDEHVVPPELALFPGVETNPAYVGPRPMCDRKQVLVADGKNTAANFFLFTDVPVAGHIKGFVLNDLGNEFNPLAPNFGEKVAPSYIPVSVRDYLGNEVYHTYTDQWGSYNAIVPATFRINSPMPSGVSPNMLQVCLNSPVRQNPANPAQLIPEPYFNRQYSQFCYTLDFKPGQTTYLDTPVLPVAAFVGPGNNQLDCDYPDVTPVIQSVTVLGSPVGGGPFVLANGTDAERTLIIASAGTVQVPDPNAIRIDGSTTTLVSRDFGFGTEPGIVTLGGVPLTVTPGNWTNDTITVVVPAGASTGQLEVRRAPAAPGGGALGRKTEHGITVIVGTDPSRVHAVAPGGSIQAQIDNPLTRPGDVVLVPPGTYHEMLVITKPIQLQGWGAGSTIINAVQSPTERLNEWRTKVNYLANCSHELGLLPGQQNNVVNAAAPCGHTPGTGLFATHEGPGILVAPREGAFNGAPARIDGLTITGADQSAGILVNGNARFIEISNNVVANNQGSNAAGIRVGHPSLLGANNEIVDCNNDDVTIHHNLVTQNGGLAGSEPGAGIGLYSGSTDYRVTSNYVCGNFATGDGAGIAHFGLSRNGLIADNKVVFNQSFDQTANRGGSGGGILVAGHPPQAVDAVTLTAGSGSVRILRNLIQGNSAGSGDGGGIALHSINGQDVIAFADPASWFAVDVLNNSIVNNVAGRAAGAISLRDALRVSIVNNTIANNDSTATVGELFNGTQSDSTPQPAGIVSHGHSAALLDARPGIGTFSDPVLLNDIIVGSRSMYWSVDAGGIGHLLVATPDSENDLAVVGVNGALSPSYSVLTTGTPEGTGTNNVFVGGTLADEGGVLVAPYFNGPPSWNPIQPDGTVLPVEGTLLGAAAVDEGGNFIDVHYGPLSPAGNYHLKTAAGNVAIDSGAAPSAAQYPNRSPDLDGDARPMGADELTAIFDRGADELVNVAAGAGGSQPPTIIQPAESASLVAYRDQPFAYQVIASDPNADQLTYALVAVDAANNVVTMPAGTGPQFDTNRGLITWTPPASGPTAANCTTTDSTTTCGFRVTVDDGAAGTAERNFQIQLVAAGVPIASPDTIQVGDYGPLGSYVEPAPGVLANDTGPAAGGPVTAQLLGNLSAGGSVALGPDGTVNYTPDSPWVGSATFQYSAVNNVGASAPTTATLVREIAVIEARFTASNTSVSLRGRDAVAGRTLTFALVQGNKEVAALGSITTGAAGDEWTHTALVDGSLYPDALPWSANNRVRITATGGSVADPYRTTFTFRNVEVMFTSAETAPLSTAFVQCPGDANGDAVIDAIDPAHPRAVCKHLGAGDGFIRLADGKELYTFGFSDLTGVAPNLAMDKGILNAQFPAPTLTFDQGDEVYLTLTNVGMLKRPDLFDPHSVHFHGFPNAAAVFDGVPESSIAINMGFSFTYYYSIVEPGTFMYHCHVEATEHMQMGMLGNLYVRPAQNGQSFGGYTQFVYNDADGSTGYDVEVPIQIGSMDSYFHDEHLAVQPLPFANMHDDYPMLNGRGYPDTVNVAALAPVAGGEKESSGVTSAAESSQTVHTRVDANAGQRILLRISNLNVTRFYTLATTGLTMKVVGTGAHILRGPGGTNLYYDTNSVTLGGGEAVDVLIDTTGIAAGTYLLYSTNLEALSNGAEDFGGMMTEIVIH